MIDPNPDSFTLYHLNSFIPCHDSNEYLTKFKSYIILYMLQGEKLKWNRKTYDCGV